MQVSSAIPGLQQQKEGLSNLSSWLFFFPCLAWLIGGDCCEVVVELRDLLLARGGDVVLPSEVLQQTGQAVHQLELDFLLAVLDDVTGQLLLDLGKLGLATRCVCGAHLLVFVAVELPALWLWALAEGEDPGSSVVVYKQLAYCA